MKNKFIALIPMKACSERVKNKNIRDICGKPLFYYIIETLHNYNNVDKIVVDTGSAACTVLAEVMRRD